MSIEPARAPNGRWRRGHSGNPEGRRAETDPERRRARGLARECTEEMIAALRSIALDENGPQMARVQAAKELLARGWGTATNEASVDALDRVQDEAEVIHFVMPMTLNATIESELVGNDELPALPPAAG